MTEVDPALARFGFLLGTWEGEGQGLWPADPPFRYRERVVFEHPGRPHLRYEQRTWALSDGAPRHAEAGYLRPGDGSAVEWVIVQPTGICEVQTGVLEDQTLTLTATAIALAPTAKRVTGVTRRLWLQDGTLRYLVRIAMNGEPLADHLAATLGRVD
jgi:THAP domain-containing protein 4